MSEFDPNLAQEDTPGQKAAWEKVEAFVLKWLREDPFLPRLKGLFDQRATPPQGFDTWEDYYKYGDAFIPVVVAARNDLVPITEDPKDGDQ